MWRGPADGPAVEPGQGAFAGQYVVDVGTCIAQQLELLAAVVGQDQGDLVALVQGYRFFRQAVEAQHVAAQGHQLLQGFAEVGLGDGEGRFAQLQARQGEVVAAAVIGQHLALPARVPQAAERVGWRGDQVAVVDQAHFAVGIGDAVGLAILEQTGDVAELAELAQLAIAVGQVVQAHWLEQLLLGEVADFRGVGGNHVVVAAVVGGELLAQLVVAAHQGDFDLDILLFGKGAHQVRVGIAGPGKDAQQRLSLQWQAEQA